ncbi:phosphohistidine phosphatase SixA [Pleionea sediminis]|uniref:phosphohistidine phosphatase SixA n=1 Tax=Pleionea sediminis TaxID=2569479 RepID=UPI001184E53D|nr:phosphohistidine phosphatase SixA [Pleionea sediminis]
MRTLYIMRHGEAEWHANSDVERELTDLGREEVVSVCRKLDLASDCVVWHSPYRRAKQTCDLLLESLSMVPSERVEEKLLTPDADPEILAQFIEHSDADVLVLVSHMPLVARLTQVLTSDDRIGGYQTAQIVQCSSTGTEGRWQVSAIYSPDKTA